MNYSQFLFTQLIRDRSEETEYDVLYEYGAQYAKFENSGYNDENKGEYECISDFLDGSTAISMETIKRKVYRDEDIYFITGLEFGKTYLSSVSHKTEFEVDNMIAIEFGLL